MATTAYGKGDEFDTATPLTDNMYSVGFDIGYVPIYDGPIGATPMRCCGAWEEDENAVNWSSLIGGGYLHWSEARCRRRG